MRNSKRKPVLKICPRCKSNYDIRSCGHDRYFCSQCCIEVKVKGSVAFIYEIDDEGRAELLGNAQCVLT